MVFRGAGVQMQTPGWAMLPAVRAVDNELGREGVPGREKQQEL